MGFFVEDELVRQTTWVSHPNFITNNERQRPVAFEAISVKGLRFALPDVNHLLASWHFGAEQSACAVDE